MQPMINVLIVLSNYLLSSFGLAIIALTIVTRGLMYPLTVKQLRSTKALQALQPKIAELQKKYAKDKNKLGREQMRLYKESGVNPAGCLVPMLVQMPVWIALFWSIIKLLAVTPEDFLGLSHFLYSWQDVYSVLPLDKNFLWLDLAEPNFVLAVLVGASMWVQQKMVTPVTTDPKQQSQARMMLWMMPIMFFAISGGLPVLFPGFPSGLALYWVISNIITIAMQYFTTGWGALVPAAASRGATRDKKYKRHIAAVEKASAPENIEADIVEPSPPPEGGPDYGRVGDKRQDRGAGYPKSIRQIRRQPRAGRRHRPKRR
jgi:YidC/Oxa1 family membrane protein insertase